MKKHSLVCCAVLALALLSGCDFLRTVAGRPTSQELQARAEEIKVVEALAKARAEAAEAQRKHEADSLAAVEFIAKEGPLRIPSSSLKGLVLDGFDYGMLIVLGGFSQPENASAFASKVDAAGYKSVILRYNYGSSIVGVCPTDDPVELRDCWLKVKEEGFCPKDAWIMVK